MFVELENGELLNVNQVTRVQSRFYPVTTSDKAVIEMTSGEKIHISEADWKTIRSMIFETELGDR